MASEHKLTMSELRKYLWRLFWNDQFEEFDIEGALLFLKKFDLLNESKIDVNACDGFEVSDVD